MGSRQSLLRKILVAGAVGAATYTATTLADQPPAWSWLLSVFVSGVTLVVQFLVAVEGRLNDLRHDVLGVADAGRLFDLPGSGPLSRATLLRLVTHVANIDPALPVLARELAQAEVERVSSFLKDLAHGRRVVYDGDEWLWCFSLAARARASIHAMSHLHSRGGVDVVDDDLWSSELGQHYLRLQAEAVKRRGVTVRRIFILEHAGLGDHPQVRQLVTQQRRLGIHVRQLDASRLQDPASGFVPAVIFDNTILCEFTSTRLSTASGHAKTALVLQPDQVQATADRFEHLWSMAQPDSDMT